MADAPALRLRLEDLTKRFGSFVALYGIPGTIGLIETALAREAA